MCAIQPMPTVGTVDINLHQFVVAFGAIARIAGLSSARSNDRKQILS
jgi:hypothetical protein